MAAASVDVSQHTVPLDTLISCLDAARSFQGLAEREKLYCHYLSRAAWEGSYICLLQTSPESVPIFVLLRELFARQPIASLRDVLKDVLTEDEFMGFLLYAGAVFSNMGNYKSFGDTKIIPSISKEKVWQVFQRSDFFKKDRDLCEQLWDSCHDAMFLLTHGNKQLGLGREGISTYYSSNVDQSDIELVQAFMMDQGLEQYNSRLFKREDAGKVTYELRLASAATTNEAVDSSDKVALLLGDHQFRDQAILVTRGDYSPLMARMIQNLEAAQEYASNEEERLMLKDYVHSFKTGSVDDHKQGSRHWIKNKGPIVETYIGFIESYRDPFGVRGEFEGFVAVVNKAMSAKFNELVCSAEDLLEQLPWPSSFEKDTFLKPDFTSLDIITFASSGIPAGINIPNYDDIRQNEGFKNVSLGNVLTAAYQDKRVTFLSSDDQEKFVKLRCPAFEVQVGLHELLGHGSGKLFRKEEDGTFNFDISAVTNPLTGDKIQNWYSAGETWDTKFRSLASSYEECRAECVGLYLCISTKVLEIFGHVGEAAADILYVNWLNMVRAGLLGLEYFSPDSKKWRQAHMQARYVILRVLLQEAPDLVSVERMPGADGKPDAVVTLNKSLIHSQGQEAIANFLRKLQVYKSTGNVAAAEALYGHFSTVSEEWLSLRDIVLLRKLPRRMLVQPLTVLKDDRVELREFACSPEGLVQSYTAQRPATYDNSLEELWRKDRHFWDF